MRRKITITNLLILFSFEIFAQVPAIQWAKCFGGTNSDVSTSLQQTADGGFIIAGYTGSNNGDVSGNHGGTDFWIIKTSSGGIMQWQKCLGGTGTDDANSIDVSSDGGFVVAGLTNSTNGDVIGNHGGAFDSWVVKLDSSGNIQWAKCFGGTGEERAQAIRQTFDGGYIVGGYTTSNDGDVSGHHSPGLEDMWVFKLDSSGNLNWQKCFGGGSRDAAFSLHPTSDSGYVVSGYTSSNNGDVSGNHGSDDYWIVKLDENGNIQWQKCLGGTNGEFSNGIKNCTDNGFIVNGYTASNNGDVNGNHDSLATGYKDGWLVKLDSSGTPEWQKCFGGSNDDYQNSVRQTFDDGFIVTGTTSSFDGDIVGNHGGLDYWIVKLDTGGSIQWQKCLGGSGTDQSTSIQQTTDGGYAISGMSSSTNGQVTGNHGGFYDYWIVKLFPEDVSIIESNFSYLNIFPNPASNEFTIHNSQFAIEKVELYNVLGEKVFSQPVTSNAKHATVSVADFSPGVYFVRLSDGTGFVTQKIIIQR